MSPCATLGLINRTRHIPVLVLSLLSLSARADGSYPGTKRQVSSRCLLGSPPRRLITGLSYLEQFLGAPNWHLTKCLPHVGQYQLAYLLNACICWRPLSNYLASAPGRGCAKGAAAKKQLLHVVYVQTLGGIKPCQAAGKQAAPNPHLTAHVGHGTCIFKVLSTRQTSLCCAGRVNGGTTPAQPHFHPSSTDVPKRSSHLPLIPCAPPQPCSGSPVEYCHLLQVKSPVPCAEPTGRSRVTRLRHLGFSFYRINYLGAREEE